MVVLQNAKLGGPMPSGNVPSRPANSIPAIPDTINPTSKPAATKPAPAPSPTPANDNK
jgi:hypothetical protein